MNQNVENRNTGCECNSDRNCKCTGFNMNADMYGNNYNMSNLCNSCESVMNDNDCDMKDMTREEMIMKIKSHQFAIIELGLYLDTHPDDEKALCLHRKYARELKELQDKYQKVYGPLTINFPCNKWRWLEEPWPWERGNF